MPITLEENYVLIQTYTPIDKHIEHLKFSGTRR